MVHLFLKSDAFSEKYCHHLFSKIMKPAAGQLLWRDFQDYYSITRPIPGNSVDGISLIPFSPQMPLILFFCKTCPWPKYNKTQQPWTLTMLVFALYDMKEVLNFHWIYFYICWGFLFFLRLDEFISYHRWATSKFSFLGYNINLCVIIWILNE